MLVTKKNIKLNNKMKTQQGQDIDTSYWTTLFSFNTEISEKKNHCYLQFTLLLVTIANCMKPCMSYMCGYKITNIYRVGALTAIETDKLGGETVWELWEVLFAPLQTFVMLYNVIVMLYTVIVMLFYVIKIVMLYNNITQQLPITKK